MGARKEGGGEHTLAVGADDGEVNVAVERGVGERLDLLWARVVVDLVGRVHAPRVVGEEASARLLPTIVSGEFYMNRN